MDWELFEYVIGFTAEDVRMRIEWEHYQGRTVDSIKLEFGICYGGSVRHAMDVHNLLRGLGIPVSAHIMSLCASAGTVVALAADEIEMEHTAQWMSHRPLFNGGTLSERSEDLRADADRLDRDEQAIRDIYVARTGKSEADIINLMKTDRFMTAQEALDFGFATRVKPLAAKAPTKAKSTARLSKFKLAVARADRRARTVRPTPTAKAATPKPSNSKPAMTKVAKPVAKAAAKPVSTPQAKANAQLVANLAKQLGVSATIEGLDDEPVAAVESTETDQDGALLYHDGPLAQGVAVFYDEELTEPAEDGSYGLADGRTISVAGGVVETITEASAEEQPENTTEEQPATGAVNLTEVLNRLNKLEAERTKDQETISGLNAELAKFKKAVPAQPSNTGKRPTPTAHQADGKSSGPARPHPMDKAKS
ncbi:hypothetical protein ASU33_06040 [Solirubrum puertoriconensis]|uniref:ATP-dependent Clp protease proteolytic subunit n=2 Tax=Solirubrum puertoriconensis TaxID=1751427 RepID=A0A9X0HJ61_SOLP1|nr:hypothetical protein ASU33_06040 [Solirubrum puertoriconensis]